MRKKWEFQDCNEELVEKIAAKFNVSKLLATVLFNRGIVDDRDVEIFLNPTRNDFHDPYLMPDMQIAVNRIVQACLLYTSRCV